MIMKEARLEPRPLLNNGPVRCATVGISCFRGGKEEGEPEDIVFPKAACGGCGRGSVLCSNTPASYLIVSQGLGCEQRGQLVQV